jgi:hypothetical protein
MHYSSRALACLAALFAVVVLFAAGTDGANTTVNFNFKGLIRKCSSRALSASGLLRPVRP